MTEVYGVGTSSDGPLAWGHAEERLGGARNYWIATTRPGGKPHAAPVWGVWVGGYLYFGTGRSSVKGRNLAHNPELVVHLESADDVVILEGEVEEVHDRTTFEAIDAAYRAKYDMGVSEAGDDGAVWYVVRCRISGPDPGPERSADPAYKGSAPGFRAPRPSGLGPVC